MEKKYLLKRKEILPPIPAYKRLIALAIGLVLLSSPLWMTWLLNTFLAGLGLQVRELCIFWALPVVFGLLFIFIGLRGQVPENYEAVLDKVGKH